MYPYPLNWLWWRSGKKVSESPPPAHQLFLGLARLATGENHPLYKILRMLVISLIPRLSHRLSYVTFRTISWSWNSSPNYFMARALRVRFHNTHESYVCRAKCRVCGTVKSELGQWIRINIGRARLKRNLDLISVFHCHWLRTQLRIKASVVHKAKIDCPVNFEARKIIPNLLVNFQ